MPTSDAAIEALCTEGGCGTLFFDLTTPIQLPPVLLRHLFSYWDQDHYHLGTGDELERRVGKPPDGQDV